jgi:uncharacterized protein YfiM (DUF2279 family)
VTAAALLAALALQLAPADAPAPPAAAPAPGGDVAHGLAAPAPAPAPDDPWVAPDKFMHFFHSLANAQLGYAGLRTVGVEQRPALAGAAAAALATGAWKEWRDRRRGGHFSLRDMAWNAAGIALSLAVSKRT